MQEGKARATAVAIAIAKRKSLAAKLQAYLFDVEHVAEPGRFCSVLLQSYSLIAAACDV